MDKENFIGSSFAINLKGQEHDQPSHIGFHRLTIFPHQAMSPPKASAGSFVNFLTGSTALQTRSYYRPVAGLCLPLWLPQLVVQATLGRLKILNRVKARTSPYWI